MKARTERQDKESSAPDMGRASKQDALSGNANFDDMRAEAVAQRRCAEYANSGPRMDRQRTTVSAIQRKTEDNAAEPNRTGLPDQLKAGIESLSGISMDGVKVHYNSSQPAQLNAHAYAQGKEIHIAPGQEKYLPHEAWHVVQQAQGRVRPNMQMKLNRAVNEDVNLEQEADVMGFRALSAGSVERKGVSGILMGSVASAPIQRKVGFEFETSNLIMGADAKQRVKSGNGFHIDADTAQGGGNCIEFVIDPAETLTIAKAYIANAVEMATSLKRNSKLDVGKVGNRVFDPSWKATAQHTEGVSMDELPHFLKTNLEDSTDHNGMYGKFKSFLDISGRENKPEDGMSQLVMWYVYALQRWETNSDTTEGPKNAMAIMSRTDFFSMYAYIKSIGREQAYKDAEEKALATLGIDRDQRLIRPGYKSSDDGNEEIKNDLTVGEWLDSFTEGFDEVILDRKGNETNKTAHKAKDELSPPKGFRHLEPEYSMGAMGMDGNLVVIESRARNQMQSVEAKDWSSYADQVFSEIKERKPVQPTTKTGASSKFWDEDYGMTRSGKPESDDVGDGYA